jgi:hypothetical protein
MLDEARTTAFADHLDRCGGDPSVRLLVGDGPRGELSFREIHGALGDWRRVLMHSTMPM